MTRKVDNAISLRNCSSINKSLLDKFIQKIAPEALKRGVSFMKSTTRNVSHLNIHIVDIDQPKRGEGSALFKLSHALEQLQVPPPNNPRKPKLVQRIEIPLSSDESDGRRSPHLPLIPRRDIPALSGSDSSDSEVTGSVKRVIDELPGIYYFSKPQLKHNLSQTPRENYQHGLHCRKY